MSRRSQLINAVRRNTAKQAAPHIIVIDAHDGREPFAIYALDHRAPTLAEIAEALAAWKREQAQQSNPQPTDTVAS